MKNNWLNSFFEKNAWSILIAVLGMATILAALNFKVKANTDDIKTLEEVIIKVVVNQKDIIELQTNQRNIVDDINEIKSDVKELLRR